MDTTTKEQWLSWLESLLLNIRTEGELCDRILLKVKQNQDPSEEEKAQLLRLLDRPVVVLNK